MKAFKTKKAQDNITVDSDTFPSGIGGCVGVSSVDKASGWKSSV